MATIYTDTWVIPTKDELLCSEREIANLKISDGCKIKNTLGERFWVIFIERTEKGEFIGKVNNTLILESAYNFNDKVIFNACDIWDVMTDQRRKVEEKRVIDRIMHFYIQYGRRPTYDEMIEMNTRISLSSN